MASLIVPSADKFRTSKPRELRGGKKRLVSGQQKRVPAQQITVRFETNGGG